MVGGQRRYHGPCNKEQPCAIAILCGVGVGGAFRFCGNGFLTLVIIPYTKVGSMMVQIKTICFVGAYIALLHVPYPSDLSTPLNVLTNRKGVSFYLCYLQLANSLRIVTYCLVTKWMRIGQPIKNRIHPPYMPYMQKGIKCKWLTNRFVECLHPLKCDSTIQQNPTTVVGSFQMKR